jgi:putative endonuclease
MVKRWGGVGSPGEAGNLAETVALQHLQRAGLRLVQRNYRVARGPGARAGEIDLIMREPDGTIVFVEVRSRAAFAAQHWLMRQPALPPCRFDVVALDGERLQWLKAAFDAG